MSDFCPFWQDLSTFIDIKVNIKISFRDKGLKHMESRNISERIKSLCKLFSLDDFMCTCLELLLFGELERELSEEEQETKLPFFGIPFIELCKMGEEVQEESAWGRLLLFTDEMWIEGRSFLRLKEEVFYYLIEGIWIGKETEAYVMYFLEEANEPEQRLYPCMLTLIDKRKEYGAESSLLLHIAGDEGSGRRKNICLFGKRKKMEVRLLRAEKIEREVYSVRKRIYELLLLECGLEGKILGIYFEAYAEKEEVVSLVRECCDIWKGQAPFIFVVTGREVRLSFLSGEGVDYALFSTDKRDGFHRETLWKYYGDIYGISVDGKLEEILQRYAFTPGKIKKIFREATNLAWSQGYERPQSEHLLSCSSRQVETRFMGKAKKLEGSFGWEDLVLPPPSMELLQSICSQVRYRGKVYGEWNFASKIFYGRGNALLFAGAPGTGKTMAAQVMAKELHMDLYRVDLSAVVSKYIGETEKNLNLIFAEAEKSMCILFFDEADVLFGKRTEVKEARDKYNNMEAAFLLQKMEEYEGISILATNLQQNIDEAFKRRLKYSVEFSMPSARERHLMWKKAFPKEAPLQENVDLAFLAENFDLTGSNIKNIAVNAAFAAAASQSSIGMSHLVKALCSEYRKCGKVLAREELKQYCMYY